MTDNAKNEEQATNYVNVQRVSPFFNKLLVVFLMGATLWNWDGFWELVPVQGILQKAFPLKYYQEKDKRDRLFEKSKIYFALEDARKIALQERNEAVSKLEDKCAYVRTAAAMFRTEHDKVKSAGNLENVKILPIDCSQSESPQRCDFIKQNKVDEICPE